VARQTRAVAKPLRSAGRSQVAVAIGEGVCADVREPNIHQPPPNSPAEAAAAAAAAAGGDGDGGAGARVDAGPCGPSGGLLPPPRGKREREREPTLRQAVHPCGQPPELAHVAEQGSGSLKRTGSPSQLHPPPCQRWWVPASPCWDRGMNSRDSRFSSAQSAHTIINNHTTQQLDTTLFCLLPHAATHGHACDILI